MAPAIVTIGGNNYYFWSTGKKDQIYLVLFGGALKPLFGSRPTYESDSFYEEIHELYSTDEYTPEKEAFVNELSVTHDVLSPAGMKLVGLYPEWRYPPYPQAPIGADFITEVGFWMRKQGYLLRNLFGFSAGGVAIAHLVTLTGEDWSNAVIASAPVHWDDFPGGREIVLTQTAHYSKLAKTNMYFIMPSQDFTETQMNDYFQNRLGGTYGNIGFGWPSGHDVFPYKGDIGWSAAQVCSNVSRYPVILQIAHRPLCKLWGQYMFSGWPAGIDFTTKRQILGYFNQYLGGDILGDGITIDTGYFLPDPIGVMPFINQMIGTVNGYIFADWNFGDLPAGSEIYGRSFIYHPNGEAYYDVNCILQPPIPENTITITVVAGPGGQISPSGTQVLTVGGQYQFAAIANPEYIFDHWDLNGTGIGTIGSLTATESMNGGTLTAVFTPTSCPIVEVPTRPSSWAEWLRLRPSLPRI